MPLHVRRKAWLMLTAGMALTLGLTCEFYGPGDIESREMAARSDLGRRLFHDSSLSATGSLACASCHRPDFAFAQPQAVPKVYADRLGTRNVPSLLDVQYFDRFFWDGRESRLDQAAVAAFANPAEMAQPDMSAVIAILHRQTAYRAQFKAAFGDETIDQARVSSAILAYLASMTKGRSRYDAYAAGHLTALTEAERRGLMIFRGKSECASCHRLSGSPARFTDNRFHHSNVGLERLDGRVKATIAVFQEKREQGKSLAELALSDPDLAALGRFAVSGRGEDLAAYRTPTLRNVTRTPPYMHDGSVRSLDEAIQREIYYRSLAHGTPITLTKQEQDDLRAFLYALEDVPGQGD